jgi:hypothetical protein
LRTCAGFAAASLAVSVASAFFLHDALSKVHAHNAQTQSAFPFTA